MWITMCGGIYDIVVIFDFEVFLGGVCFLNFDLLTKFIS